MAGVSASLAAARADVPPAAGLLLWYRKPADKWTDALPIGNGRLGAMVFGGAPVERIQLNENTLWSGAPRPWNNPEAKQHLPEVRRLVLEEQDYVAADGVCKKMQGPYNESYLPMADLHLRMDHGPEVNAYRRELDLDTGLSRVSYRVGTAEYVREAFASFPDQVIALRLTTTDPAGMGLTLTLDSLVRSTTAVAGEGLMVLTGKAPAHTEPNYVRSNNAVVYDDAPGKGMRFEVAVQAEVEGGSVTAEGNGLRIDGARAVVLLLAGQTGYRGYDRDPTGSAEEIAAGNRGVLQAARGKSYDELRRAHIADHQKLFRRVSLALPKLASAELPTDERLRAFTERPDPDLVALYFQYGRYLLISSSRPGSQPANLQGIWNSELRPPWSSNWTANINVQMNYWPAESCNLPECHEPLFDLIEGLSQTGRKPRPSTTAAAAGFRTTTWTCGGNRRRWAISAAEGPPGPTGA